MTLFYQPMLKKLGPKDGWESHGKFQKRDGGSGAVLASKMVPKTQNIFRGHLLDGSWAALGRYSGSSCTHAGAQKAPDIDKKSIKNINDSDLTSWQKLRVEFLRF